MLGRQPSPQPPTPAGPASSQNGKRKRGSPASNSPKRKRGGQPGNQNARKQGIYARHQPGPLSHIPYKITELNQAICVCSRSLDEVRQEVDQALSELESVQPASNRELLSHHKLMFRLVKISSAAALAEAALQIKYQALEKLARDPFDYFERWVKRAGISRDADSFFIVSEKSVHNSPLPPSHPRLATDLTDDQWAVLAPLVPPDPYLSHIYGQPPAIIAANRLKFTRYTPDGEFADFAITQEYMEFLRQRLPHLLTPPRSTTSGKKCGRPRSPSNHPRALLDAIFWKLATGHTWQELPNGFPPVRTCQKYYRRLFLSGRFYTLVLALYNHMRLELCVDPWILLEDRLFTATPNQRIALVPEAAPTSENYTALLFMQLARTAYAAFERDRKESQPFYTPKLVFKGEGRLSTARLPGQEPWPEEPEFIPLEESLLWKKTSKLERTQKAITRQASRRAPPQLQNILSGRREAKPKGTSAAEPE